MLTESRAIYNTPIEAIKITLITLNKQSVDVENLRIHANKVYNATKNDLCTKTMWKMKIQNIDRPRYEVFKFKV